MSNIINESGRLNFGGSDRELTTLIIGPVKTVTDSEQFVPLFTCRPRMTIGRIVPVRANSYGTSFWEHTAAFLNSLSNGVANNLSNILIVAARDVSSIFSTSRQTSILSKVRSSDWNYLKTQVEKGLIAVDHETWVRTLIEVFNGGLPPAKAATLGWKYALKETGEIQGITDMTAMISLVSDRFNGGVNICYTGMTISRNVYSDWFYLADVAEKGPDRLPVIPGITTPDLHFYSGSATLLNGVTSLFCVMIKEKYRLDVMLNLWINGTMGELPKGSIELWEYKGLRDYMGTHYKHYQKTVQAIVRNTLRSPVRVFDDLDAQLFDIKKTEFNSPAEIEAEAELVLKRAQTVTTTFSHAMYSSNLQLDGRTTHVNL